MGHFHRLAGQTELSDASDSARRPWWRAVAWLAFLGSFFFCSYVFANWVASQRADVPSAVFDWERAIPFWPWTIVPYWIIDLLFAASLFVCVSRRRAAPRHEMSPLGGQHSGEAATVGLDDGRGELDIHGKRLFTAQIVAVLCFIAFPYRFSFERPPVEGFFGFLFNVLLGFDLPFNQIPSLHIALAVILWSLYSAHASRGWRIFYSGLFLLIGASVLTTYQHHFIDIPTGFALGWFCIWLWPNDAQLRPAFHRSRDRQRLRIASFYGVGALVTVAIAKTIGGIALWLLWPAISLALVALIYAAIGAHGFQKSADGRLSLAARWLLAPYLAGAWINSRWWTRLLPDPSHVTDGVWIGRTPTERIHSALDELGRREIQDLFLEGGPTLAGALFDAGEIDEVRLFLAPVLVGAAQARAVLEGEGVARIAEGVHPLSTSFEEVGEDLLVRARLREW